MIHGCGKSSNLVNLQSAIVVDTTAERCPAPAAKDVSEFSRWVEVPMPDVKTSDARGAYSVAALQKWIDAHEAGQWRKNQSGRRLVREIQQCRGVSEKINPNHSTEGA